MLDGNLVTNACNQTCYMHFMQLSFLFNEILFFFRILLPTFNCLSFTKVMRNEKAGFIIRQYIKYTVYDRYDSGREGILG